MTKRLGLCRKQSHHFADEEMRTLQKNSLIISMMILAF